MSVVESGIARAASPVVTGSGESEVDEEDDEDLSAENSDSDMDQEDDGDLSAVLESVHDVLGATQLLLQREFEKKKLAKKLKGRWFLFHDGEFYPIN